MNVLALTVFLSLVLAAGFVLCFLHARNRNHFENLDREALRPLENDETEPSQR